MTNRLLLSTCFLILLAAILPPPVLRAQNIDSLEQVLRTRQLTADEQIRIYDDLSWAYLSRVPEKSADYARRGISLSLQEKDDQMTATLYRNLGVAYYMWNRHDTAVTYLDQALELALKIKDDKLESRIYAAMANVYQITGRYHEAVANYLKALPFAEAEGNPASLGLLYSNLAGAYHKMENRQQASKYYSIAEDLARETGDRQGLAGVLVFRAEEVMDTNKDKAVEYARESAELYHELGLLQSQSISLLTVAKSYYIHDDLLPAMEYARKGLGVAEAGDFGNAKADALVIISNIHYRGKRYAESKAAALKAWQSDSTDANITGNIVANLVRSNMYLGKPVDAEFYFDIYRDLLNERSTSEFQRTLSEMEIKYETEKKELLIIALEERNRLYLGLGIAAGVVLLLTVAILIFRHRLAVSRRQLAEQQVMQLEKEKQLTTMQAVLEGETAERSRLAKDLHDGLGSMLSVVKLNLPEMKSGAVLDAEDMQRFNSAIGMLDDSIHELRRVAHHMMPESLLRYGLKVSLSDFCNAIPSVEFHYFGNEHRLDNKLEILIYRSAHELVNNALKHGAAMQINVQLIQEEDRLSLTVQDNGQGFDPKAGTGGMGLQNIRNRVETYGGVLHIYSTPRNGTEINLEFDLKKTEE